MGSYQVTMSITQEVEGVEYDMEYIIDYTVYPGSMGKREEGTGLQLEPDEPPTIEIDSIKQRKDHDGLIEVIPTDEMEAEIYERLDKHEKNSIYSPLNYLI